MEASVKAKPVRRAYAPRASVEERRRQILDVALPLCVERGFTAMRLDEVADQVGVSKPVIYKIFSSKDELAMAVIEKAHEIEAGLHLADGAGEAYAQIAEGRIAPIFESAFRVAADNRPLHRFLYVPLRDAPPQAAEFHEQCFRHRAQGIEHFALQYFAGRQDAAERAFELGRVAGAIGRLGLARVASSEDIDRAAAEQLGRDYGALLEQGIQGA